MILFVKVSEAQTQDSIQREIKYPPIPLTDDELTSIRSNQEFTNFIQVIHKEDLTLENKVFYFIVNSQNGSSFDRMLISLFKDDLVIKLQPNQEKIAILVKSSFDIEVLKKDAEQSGISLMPITKEAFFSNLDEIKN
jgi:hypothetical protein